MVSLHLLHTIYKCLCFLDSWLAVCGADGTPVPFVLWQMPYNLMSWHIKGHYKPCLLKSNTGVPFAFLSGLEKIILPSNNLSFENGTILIYRIYLYIYIYWFSYIFFSSFSALRWLDKLNHAKRVAVASAVRGLDFWQRNQNRQRIRETYKREKNPLYTYNHTLVLKTTVAHGKSQYS